ncbi:MAG: superoxide dismutase [Bacteroidales bacterium]|nr:superoxide dismutase [Bacteroidales bacterium]
MKLLAIEKETIQVNWNEENEVLINEAYRAYELFQQGIFRELYFTELENAVIVLECESKENAEQVLATLPLVKAGFIRFELMELHPYTGFSRIIYKA